MDENQVLEIFRQLDHNATGFVGREEFRSVFGQYIGTKLADDIFLVLDQDGDGVMKIKDLINELRIYMRENAFSLDEPSTGDVIERRTSDIMLAWSQVVEAIGEPAVRKFLNNSGKKLEELYHELQSRCTAPDLIDHVEGALTSLFQDVKQVLDDNEKLKHMFHKEKETHLERLRGLEDELDAQVAKVEAEAREQACLKFEQEKKELMEKLETEMAEMQTRLKLFEKVNAILTQKIEEKNNRRHESTTQKAELRSTLTHTNTNLALVEAEMARMRADYEVKCKELDSHQEVFMQFIDRNEHIQRQLSLLHKANKSLQDTNDSLLSAIETHGGRITPFCCSRNGSDTNSNPSEKSHSYIHSIRNTHDTTIRQDILREHIQHCGAPYTIQRLMDDIDSGHATLRDHIDYDSDPKSLQEELCSLSDVESALKSVELNDRRCACSSVGRHYQNKSNSYLTDSSYHEPTGEPDRTYKVVLAGDAAVGKSCLIHRFCKGSFVKRLGSTLGVDFQIKTIRIDEKNVALQLWDTAGQERFRSMTKTYFRRADGIVLLYDVTSERSFLNIKQWIQSINEAADKNIPTLICANKVDLREEVQHLGARCVTKESGENLAKDYQALFYETSSKTGENILDALIALSREMLLREDVEVQTSALKVTRSEKKSYCCSGTARES